MNIVLYLLFFAVFVLDYLGIKLGIGGRYVTLVPEILSAIVLIVVVIGASVGRRMAIKPKYVAFFALFLLVILVGAIINSVSPGTMVAGIRNYLKYFPFFLLPAVFDFSDSEIKRQLNWLLFFSLLQLPVVLFQRFVQFSHTRGGDEITGTLNVSSCLSIYLICAISVLIAFRLRNKIGGPVFWVILFCLFMPTALNETKGTLFLLPIALVSPILFARGDAPRMKKLFGSLALIGFLFALYVPIYNAINPIKSGGNVVEFMTSWTMLKNYLYGGAASSAIGATPGKPVVIGSKNGSPEDRVGRIDAIVLPLKTLASDPVKLLIGVGIGNVSKSFVSKFDGEYSGYIEIGATRSATSQLLWELGVIGIILSLTFCYLVLADAWCLRVNDTLSGTVALGWIAVVIIMVLSLSYKNILVFNVLGYLFWYISGYLAAARYRSEYLAQT